MSEILFVTRNFPPLLGGMERLALESVGALAQEWTIDVVGPSGCQRWIKPPNHGIGVTHRRVLGFLLLGAWHALRLARSGKRKAIIGGSGLTAPLVLAAALRSRRPGCCFVHGLDLVVRHPVYRMIFLPALRRLDLILANSANTAELARRAGIDPSRIRVIYPGVQPDGIEPAVGALSSYPRLRDRLLLLSVGRLLPRKGIVDFVEHVMPIVALRHPDVLLVVVGGEANDALVRADKERLRLEAAIERKSLSNHVLVAGYLDDQHLAAFYDAAQALVFPIKDLPGDVEGFGMVALEAAAHGLPTIAFDAGGVADAVREGESGTLVPAGDYVAMAAKVSEYLVGDTAGVSSDSCRAFARSRGWDRYGGRLRGEVRRLIKDSEPAVPEK